MYSHYSYTTTTDPEGNLLGTIRDVTGKVVHTTEPRALLCGLEDELRLWAVENNVQYLHLIEGKIPVSLINPGCEMPESGYVGKKTHRVEGEFIRVCDCFGKVHRSYYFYDGKLYIQWNLRPGEPEEELPLGVYDIDWIEVALEYDVKRFQGAFVDWTSE